MDVSHADILEHLHYDPLTGVFTWLKHKNVSFVGRKAGFQGGPGYWQIRHRRILHYAHRLAYFYMTGSWPMGVIDHRDGDKQNNAWDNLRVGTKADNSHNMRKPQKVCSSSMKGVSRNRKLAKWQAHIRIGGKSTYLGLFDSEIDANAAYRTAAEKHYGEFARGQ